MKSFGAAMLVATALISSIGVAAAQQYGGRVPITRNY
jgi:hypothetical protein